MFCGLPLLSAWTRIPSSEECRAVFRKGNDVRYRELIEVHVQVGKDFVLTTQHWASALVKGAGRVTKDLGLMSDSQEMPSYGPGGKITPNGSSLNKDKVQVLNLDSS